ncbi:TetR/AcrR family transcriptional regulator [Aestuariivita boseongensis]|uniref:TetR/AcrR family transcriptional regulator n=1 Tax=Aestuariivita boseongensis TaxID=1470562 RepID=UPI0009E5D572|nr:TetR/AcrR family transcriptional regulator [Aestuariivita boseongensis]
MNEETGDSKRQAILQAAWQVFAAYGYRKTSMDDIARAAGMSRPAVYLHFKGKEEIFRSLAQSYFDTACDAVAQALSQDDSVAQSLERAFEAQAGETIAAMLGSAHGRELLDAGETAAPDIAAEGEARLTAIYATWLQRLADQGRVDLAGDATATAATISAAYKGIKTASPDFPSFQQHLRILARSIGQGLTRAG